MYHHLNLVVFDADDDGLVKIRRLENTLRNGELFDDGER
jgi:hypothetical protein